MATKKQKRAAAEAKRKAFLEEYHAQGLQAQLIDRRKREARQKQRESEAKAAADRKEQAKTDALIAVDNSSIEQECI